MASSPAGGEPTVAARKPPTIYDVAKLAGVSHQTVSRYLKGGQRIHPDIRERVMRALKLLDYKPNSAARAQLASAAVTTIRSLDLDFTPNSFIGG